MASQELSPPQSSDLEKRDDTVDPSTTSSSPGYGLNEKQGAETTAKAPPAIQEKEPEWAHGFQLFNILTAVTFVCFLMLLDGTIVNAAVPRITDQFDSLNDIGWYGAAYQLGRYVNSSVE
jgi:hypothetical protein